MSRLALHITRKQVTGWLLVQTVTVFLFSLTLYFFYGKLFAASVLVGGLLSLFPQWVFAKFWLSHYKANAARQIVQTFYVAELLKLFIIAVLFLLCLFFLPLHMLACIIGFMAAQLSFWLAPFVLPQRSS